MRIRLSSFDNVSFAAAAPPSGLIGEVVRRMALRDWGDNWFLLALETSVDYHGRANNHLLVRSRWVGREVGELEPTSVFILTYSNPEVLDKVTFESNDFEHVTWGMANTEVL
jgi:hypothetical protein